MPIAIILSVALGVPLLLFGAWRATLTNRLRKKVVVHTTNGTSLSGVLVGTFPGHVVLRHAAILIDAQTQEESLAGDILVQRRSIDFIQVV